MEENIPLRLDFVEKSRINFQFNLIFHPCSGYTNSIGCNIKYVLSKIFVQMRPSSAEAIMGTSCGLSGHN